MHYLCLKSCLEINRPEKIYLYYHYMPYGKFWDLIKQHLTLVKVDLNDFVSKFKYTRENKGCKKYSYAHHSDFIRLEKLHEHGGIYADIDTIFVNKIPDILFEKNCVLGRESDVICQSTMKKRPSLCNALIMCQKNSEFIKAWFEQMISYFNGSWSNHSTFLPYELSMQYPEHIHIEPEQTFYPFMWTKTDLDLLFKGNISELSQSVSIHLWSHLWWSKKRKDFSDFHADLLTEDFIRKVDSTYNIIARRFL
ncbi:MAG: glycosyltransferase [Pseudomonadota bacterium]